MKIYIKASFDASMPQWLKNEFVRKGWGRNIRGDYFVDKFGVALSDAVFTDAPSGSNSLPIYLLKTDYGTSVYIPGLNDDDTAQFSGRSRKFGTIAKSKLASMSEDVVYLDLDANKVDKSTYEDPRYIYDRNGRKGKGSYGGQYYSEYSGTWKNGRARSERRDRDKSGYRIPSPEEQLTRFYTKFPERVTQKVDALYEKLISVRDQVLSDDMLNTPFDRKESTNVGNAMYRLKDAIEAYRKLLATLNSDRQLSGKDEYGWDDKDAIKSFSESVKAISNYLDEAIDDMQRGGY